MPELPETETIARDLDGALRGAVLRSVHLLRADVLRVGDASGRRESERAGIEATITRALSDATITRVYRRAKCIVLECGTRGSMVVTPRFTGALLIDAARSAYDCLRFELGDGRRLSYRDVRRLGTVGWFTPETLAAWNASLGPEPLDPELTAERFSGILRSTSRAVKTVLMDQRRLAGVGNIYANEGCWRARVRPTRRASSLTRAESARLLDALRGVLSESIALRGTTFRDFQDAYGGRGGFAAKLEVYGRGGQPCVVCDTALTESHKLENRSTVWCARCQH